MKKIKYSALLFLMIITATSCNKWLDLKPEDGIIRQNYWNTKEQLNAAVTGCYSSLLNNNLITQLFRWGEMRADMIGLTIRASIDDVNIKDNNLLSSNSITRWAEVYQTINYCNTVIEFAPSVKEKDNTLTELQLNAYLAEAHGLRGLMYFYLLRSFGEVPLQLKATSSDATLDQLEKSSQTDVYNQILEDLKFAEQNAVLSYNNNNTNKGRITKYSVYAMLADVYLWNDDYANAITYSDKIINSNLYSLYMADNTQSFFTTVFRDGNSQESIFELQFDLQKQSPAFNLFAATARPYTITNKALDYFGLDDVDPSNVDFRGDGNSFRSSDQSIAKHAGIYDGSTFNLVTSTTSTANWFLYRYSDILLLKAEALAWSNRGQEALDIIAAIRTRAHALSSTIEAPAADNPEGISEYILRERSREFAFEGKRWYDMLRISKRNNYRQIDLMIAIVAESAPADRQQSIINKYRDSRSHYLPINEYELQADRNLVQNPFYK